MEQFPEDPRGVRLAKYLSAAGISSRRKCEQLIAEGRVSVNGRAVLTPVCVVVPGVDEVTYEDKPVSLPEHRYFLLNKPVGYTCTREDAHAEKLVYELLPPEMGSLYYVGRLDRDTEGLLLLTNDGELVQALTHPSREIPKTYVADVTGWFSEDAAQAMVEGLEDGGEFLVARSIRILREYSERRLLLEVVLTEGKKREVRRLCRAVGLRVNRLARVALANLRLGSLPTGQWRALTPEELSALRSTAGV